MAETITVFEFFQKVGARMSTFPENTFPYRAMPPLRTISQMHFYYLCCTVSFHNNGLEEHINAYHYMCFYWDHVLKLTREQIRKLEYYHPFHEVGRFYFKKFRLVDPDCQDNRESLKTMPLVSLRRVNTLKEVFRCYKKMLDCNVAELIAFNHELYKPGGLGMLEIAKKYT